MKIILTLLIFIVAFYLAAMMFRRLTQTMQQLADLRTDLAKSDVQLQAKLAALQTAGEAQRTKELQETTGANALNTGTSSPRSDTEHQTSSTQSDA
jgi:septation ring formation regulator EzrA